MKALVFDAGPIISLTMNNLLWLLPELQKRFQGKFIISAAVEHELVEKPLQTKRFEFEGFQVTEYISNKTLEVSHEVAEEKTLHLLSIANSCFQANGQDLRIVQFAEMETLLLAKMIGADAAAIDERTTRLLIEDPKKLHYILEHKLHQKVTMQKGSLRDFHRHVGSVKIIRSVEMGYAAYRLGMLDRYISSPKQKKQLLDAMLWGIKLDGCAVSKKEIAEMMRMG
ncbi:hypothetical protein HY491_01085 [Candidatus Woesearchaeota archaeon]|nr:hypothetical protein [Candidatus Woesearchaeota archaeon]